MHADGSGGIPMGDRVVDEGAEMSGRLHRDRSDTVLSIDRQVHPRWLFPASSDGWPLGTKAAGYLLPVVVFLPVLCGLLVLAAERAGWLATPGALLVSVAAGVAGTSIATLLVARWLNRVATVHGERTEVFRAIADAMGEGVVVASPDARLTYFNPAAETILGMGISNAEAADWAAEYGVFRHDTVTPLPTDELAVLRAIRGERSDGVETFIRNANLQEGAYIRTNARPILDPAGQVVGGVATFRDVTEEVRAQDEIARGRALFEGLFEYAPDAVIAVDLEGCVRLVNRQAEELFGYSKQELLGLAVETLLPDRARTSHIALRERYTASPDRRPRRGDVIGLRKGGAEFPAAVALGPINLSSGTLVLASVRDVSEERQDKDTIQRLKADLARNADELKTVNDELKSFSYSVSHDLRAPLRSMVGYSTIILEDFGDALPPEAKGHLGRIIAATNKMGELIDGLLALSRIIRRDMVRQNVDLSVLAEEALRHRQAGAPGRDVSIRVAEKLRVVGDRQLLQIAVTNLVDNAWKFTRHTDNPKIEVGVAIEKGQPVYFVRDNGVGFDMKYADKLFGVFQKLHGEREYEGPGIGLATAHRVILRHGGKLWATAEPGQGATFYFTLPQPVEGGDE